MEFYGNDGRLSYCEAGPKGGLPLVLIHGFPLSHAMWAPQIEALSATCRVIAYDVRGFGESEPGDGQHTMDTYGDDLIALLDHLNIPQAVVCGLSMGGYIALRAYERFAGRFKALILCDTKSEADTDEGKIGRWGMIKKVKKRGTEFFTEEFLKGVFKAETFEKNPELIRKTLDDVRTNSASGVCAALLAMAARTNTTPMLSTIKVPTLVLVGDQDALTPPAGAEKMAKAIPGAQYQVIPNAAHMSNLENAPVFNERALQFLKSLSL